ASFLFSSGLTSWQVAAFAPLAATCTATIYGCYGLLFSARSVAELYRRFWRAMDGLFGAVFGILGMKLLLDGLKEVKI
ncbi:MAG: LysE family translocator, partial [Roseibium sp.]|nr:LysE family translocator [Roseibium sp.]